MIYILQEEDQDPLLNNFSQLKDTLNSISGRLLDSINCYHHAGIVVRSDSEMPHFRFRFFHLNSGDFFIGCFLYRSIGPCVLNWGAKRLEPGSLCEILHAIINISH